MQTRTTWAKKSRLVKKWTNNKWKTSKTWTNKSRVVKHALKKKDQ